MRVAQLGPSVQPRRTEYDVELAAARIAASDYVEVEEWVRQYVREPPSDAEALEVFTSLVDPLP